MVEKQDWEAAVERAMKVQDVIMRAMAKRITCSFAKQILLFDESFRSSPRHVLIEAVDDLADAN